MTVQAIVNRVNQLAIEFKTFTSMAASVSDKFPPKSTSAIANSSENKQAGDEDVNLFASDSEDDAAAAQMKAERVKAYEEKKKNKTAVVAKSSIILDIKPWDDETDMAKMEEAVRSVHCDGLVWGQSKLIPLAYGIKKLQIACVVEDEKVGTDFLEEAITAFSDLIQS
ncbi:unnamed protein product, partial [Protopolystoma xenopodis]